MKQKVIKGLFWRFAEKCGAQSVNFIVSIILARLLLPSDYGTIALITVFINVSYTFISGGFGVALIQKKDVDEVDLATVFFFNTVVSFVCYFALYVTAPLIAGFYEIPILTKVIRVLALTLILGGISGVQGSIVVKYMQFKQSFWATSIGAAISAVVGVFMAYRGYGVWALVGQQFTNQLFNTLILWYIVPWRPTLQFSFIKLKGLFQYGWKILLTGLVDTMYNNLYTLVIGKVYTSKELGYYNKGQSFPMLIISNINATIDSVLFSAMSMEQSDLKVVKRMTRRSIITSTFIIFPAMAGLAGIAEPLVTLLLTEKWLPCASFLMFSSFVYAFWPIHTANLQAIKALGYSGTVLKLELQKKGIGLILLVLSIPFGIRVMMIGRCISALICWAINVAPNRRILKYGLKEQFLDVAPAGGLSIVMFGIVYLIGKINLPPIALIVLQMIIGSLFYISMAALFKMETFEYLKAYVRSKLKVKTKHK